MIKIKYDYNLKEDIENSKKVFNRKKQILGRIRAYFISLPLLILINICFHGFSLEDFKSFVLFVCSYSVTTVVIQYVSYRYDNKIVKEKTRRANDRLNVFCLHLGRENVDVTLEQLKNSEVISFKEESFESINQKEKSSEVITDSFYFLDSHEKIRVLKSIREIVKEWKEVISDDIDLYYAEEESDSLCLPVTISKRLERK